MLSHINIQIEVQYVYKEVDPPSARNPQISIKPDAKESIRSERIVVTGDRDNAFKKAAAALDILKIV